MNKIWRLLRHDWPLHFALFFTNWLPDNVPFLALRGACARPFLGKCGKRLKLGRNVVLYNASRLSFGEDVYLAYGCWFMAGDQIVVGNGVMFGPYSVIVSSEHRRENRTFRHGVPAIAPIKIGNGCWLAAHVTVTAGVTLGNGCLVAAGAVVTHDVEPDTVVGGVPARKIKRSDDQPVVRDAGQTARL